MSDNAKRYDNWPSRLADRSSVSLRFFDSYKPVGIEAIESFMNLVELLSDKKLPPVIDAFNCPFGGRPLNDTRVVFGSPREAQCFVNIVSRVSFRSLKLLNIAFVDWTASIKNLDNSSSRVLMEEHGDEKVTKRIGATTSPASMTFQENNPHLSILTYYSRSDATPPRTVPTPLSSHYNTPEFSPDEVFEEEGNGKRTANESLEDLFAGFDKTHVKRALSGNSDVSLGVHCAAGNPKTTSKFTTVSTTKDTVNIVSMEAREGPAKGHESTERQISQVMPGEYVHEKMFAAPESREAANDRLSTLKQRIKGVLENRIRGMDEIKKREVLETLKKELKYITDLLSNDSAATEANGGIEWEWREIIDIFGEQ